MIPATAELRDAGFPGLLRFYREHLTRHVMPFWVERAIDREHGGVTNIITDDGRVTSTEKYLWSQGRALFTFASLYSDFDGDPAWLETAGPIAAFLLRHGRDGDGRWHFALHRDGSVLRPPASVYVDGFAAYGLGEYARATGDRAALDASLQTLRRLDPLLERHEELPTEPHPIPPPFAAHGVWMMFAMVFDHVGRIAGDDALCARAVELADRVFAWHVHPELEALLEFVLPGGRYRDDDVGNTLVPGHAIESMWFLERVYRGHPRRSERLRAAMDVIRWSLQRGWDDELGGLFLACHLTGGTPRWHAPDAKVWWPHTEAFVTLLRFFELTGQEWLMEWYWRVHDYAFSRFPAVAGDWHQNLDRAGRPAAVAVKGLAVKDPFHLPRALIYGIDCLRRLASTKGV